MIPSSTRTSWWPTPPKGGRDLVGPDAPCSTPHARTAGFIYQAALRAGLGRALGVSFGPVTRAMAELEGVPRGLLRLSRRRAEIERLPAATGTTSARAAEAAALVTRSAKELGAKELGAESGPLLRRGWLDRAASLDLTVEAHGVFAHLLGAQTWALPEEAEFYALLGRL